MRHAEGLGVDIDRLGRRRRLARTAASRRSSRPGTEVRRVAAAKDETDTELAVRIALERGVDGVVIVGGFGGAGSITPWRTSASWPCPSSRDAVPSCVDARVRIRRATGAGHGAAPGSGPATWSRSCRTAARRSTSPRTVCVYPLRGESLRPGPPRGLSNVIDRSPATVSLGSGSMLVIESPLPSTMSMPDRRRSGPRGRPAGRDRHDPRPGRPARPLDHPVLLPEGRYARAAPSRRAPSGTPTRRSSSAARTCGASARRAPPASGRSARSSTSRSRSSPTRTTRSPRPTARGWRSRTTARRTGGRPGRRSSSTPKGGSRGSGRRSSRRAMRPRSWPPSTTSSRAS